MSAVRVTWRRTLGMARETYVTAFAVAAFLASAAAIFAFNLETAEGGRLSLASVWTLSEAIALPVLASLVAMDVWSGERRSGRMEALLAAPVRERDLVLGKFLGVWALVSLTVGVSFVASLVELLLEAPSALAGVRIVGFLPGFAFLLLQGALWSAVAVAASAAFRQGAVAAVVSVALTAALPRGVWAALMAWAPGGRPSFGEMPLDAQAIDFASGIVSLDVVAAYLAVTAVALVIASKLVMAVRLVGRGAAGLRFTTGIAIVLALAFAVLAVMLSARVDAAVDLTLGSGSHRFSQRTRDILAEAGGDIRVTVYLPRNDPNFRPAGLFLRALRREAASIGGVRLDIRNVDPRWDLGASERLVSAGVSEYGLVFEKGRRTVALPIREGFSERLCASTIQRLTAHPQRRNIYWTFGHGESGYGEYGAFGMSDIARDLSREGYRHANIDLAGEKGVPTDCALVVVTGARNAFSRAELDRLDAYLKQGGRLLVMLNEAGQGGVEALLSNWGMRSAALPLTGVKTLSGSDVVVSDFSAHAIVASLKGSRIVLERPIAFAPTAAVETGTGADSIGFTTLASVGGQTVAAVVERGVGAGRDLSLRPTRIVAVGDASFAMNGALTARANANRDFFLNCIAYLAGADTAGASGTEADVLVTGLDRAARRRMVLQLAVAFPLAAFALVLGLVFLRRHRS